MRKSSAKPPWRSAHADNTSTPAAIEREGLTPAEEAFVLQRIEQRFGPPTSDEVKPYQSRNAPARSTRIAAVLFDGAL
jgi:hypothetical protein